MRTLIHSTWIHIRSACIFSADFASLNDDPRTLQREIEAARAAVENQTEDSLLVLLDMRRTRLTVEIERFLRESNRPVRKMAVLGVSLPQRTWYRLAGRAAWPSKAVFFRDCEKARKWLAA
jgi:hypothetical protein